MDVILGIILIYFVSLSSLVICFFVPERENRTDASGSEADKGDKSPPGSAKKKKKKKKGKSHISSVVDLFWW